MKAVLTAKGSSTDPSSAPMQRCFSECSLSNCSPVLELKRRLAEHVESVTTTSEGGTSADDAASRLDSDRSVHFLIVLVS